MVKVSPTMKQIFLLFLYFFLIRQSFSASLKTEKLTKVESNKNPQSSMTEKIQRVFDQIYRNFFRRILANRRWEKSEARTRTATEKFFDDIYTSLDSLGPAQVRSLLKSSVGIFQGVFADFLGIKFMNCDTVNDCFAFNPGLSSTNSTI